MSRHQARDTADVVDEPLDPAMGQTRSTTEETLRPGIRRLRIEDWSKPFTKQYAIADHDAVVFLCCRGPWSFGNRWLAIAESVEFLPAGA